MDSGGGPDIDARAARASVRTRMARLARLLDSAVRLPGTNFRIGIDPIAGIIPGAGDLVAGAIGLYIVMEARSIGAPNSLLLRMLGNLAVDTVIGSVPVAGTIFDAIYKANSRNIRLLDQWLDSVDAAAPVEPAGPVSSRRR